MILKHAIISSHVLIHCTNDHCIIAWSEECIRRDSVVSVIPVDNFPQALLFNPSNNDIYVANRGSRTVSVIDGSNSTLLDTAIVGSEPVALLFNPSNTDVYVGSVVSNSVSILDSEKNTVAGTVDINSLPLALEFNPSNKAVYVAGTLTGVDGLISVIE